MLLNRLEQISNQYDATWLSPKGRWCRVTKDGLLIEKRGGKNPDRFDGAISYGQLKTEDLESILHDNEHDIRKDGLEYVPHEKFLEAGRKIKVIIEKSKGMLALVPTPNRQKQLEIKKTGVDGGFHPPVKKNPGESNVVRLRESDKDFVISDELPF